MELRELGSHESGQRVAPEFTYVPVEQVVRDALATVEP
jgi:hypothetical protein